MNGAYCYSHIATTLDGRDPVLCPQYLVNIARECHRCGSESPGVRLARFCENPERAGVKGDVEKAAARNRGHARRAGA